MTHFDSVCLFTNSYYLLVPPNLPFFLFFFNDPPTPEIYPLSLHDALPIYDGLNPADTAWTLKGLYKISKPLGRRCILKAGGDIAIMTEDGIVPMSISPPAFRMQRRPRGFGIGRAHVRTPVTPSSRIPSSPC